MGLCMDTDKKLPEDYDDGEVLSKYRSKEFSQKAEDITGSHEEFAEEIVIENMDYESESEGEHINHLRQTGLVSLKQFEFVKVVGRGAFGKVLLVIYKPTGKYYAMKILKKEHVQKKHQKEHTQNERIILENVKHPFIVQLHFAFQSESKLYLITDFLIGGELFFHLRRAYKFHEDKAKFYAAELLTAIEYLHAKEIIYRDLKPENVLIAEDGHVKITDFGLSKMNIKDGEKTNSICGTPEYLAPEILLGNGYTKCADWWSLGALLYEMLAGAPPFYSRDKGQMFKNRMEKPIEIKSWFSEKASRLLEALLCNNPEKRLGNQGAYEIKQHVFFEEMDWSKVVRKEIEPPFKPRLASQYDLRNFDPVFTQEQVTDTPVLWDTQKNDEYEKFTYVKGMESVSERYSGVQSLNKAKDNASYLIINENFKLK